MTPSVPSCQQRQNLNKRVTQRRKSSSDFLLIFEPESQRLPVCKRLTLSLLSFLSLFGFSFCCVSSFLWPVFPLSVFLWAFSPPGIISADQSSLMQICLSKSYIFHLPLALFLRSLSASAARAETCRYLLTHPHIRITDLLADGTRLLRACHHVNNVQSNLPLGWFHFQLVQQNRTTLQINEAQLTELMEHEKPNKSWR